MGPQCAQHWCFSDLEFDDNCIWDTDPSYIVESAGHRLHDGGGGICGEARFCGFGGNFPVIIIPSEIYRLTTDSYVFRVIRTPAQQCTLNSSISLSLKTPTLNKSEAAETLFLFSTRHEAFACQLKTTRWISTWRSKPQV
jgi:hypothetical protein